MAFDRSVRRAEVLNMRHDMRALALGRSHTVAVLYALSARHTNDALPLSAVDTQCTYCDCKAFALPQRLDAAKR